MNRAQTLNWRNKKRRLLLSLLELKPSTSAGDVRHCCTNILQLSSSAQQLEGQSLVSAPSPFCLLLHLHSKELSWVTSELGWNDSCFSAFSSRRFQASPTHPHKTMSSNEPHLEQPGEDVELEDRDVVVTGEVNGGLESHGLQAQTDGVKLMESLSKRPPWHYGPRIHGREGVVL